MEKKASVNDKKDICCSKEHLVSNDTNKHTTRDLCPYCGIRIEDPMEFLRHVFLFHST